MNKFIAIDQATKVCGYAIFDNYKLIEYGVFTSKNKDILVRIEEIYIQLHNKIVEQDIKQFIFEDTFNKTNASVSKGLAWLQGALMSMAFINDYAFNMYMPAAGGPITTLTIFDPVFFAIMFVGIA